MEVINKPDIEILFLALSHCPLFSSLAQKFCGTFHVSLPVQSYWSDSEGIIGQRVLFLKDIAYTPW